MSRDGFDPYASDSDPRGTRSHPDRRLPPLHQVLGDVLDQPLMPRPSRRALSDGWRNHSTPNVYEHGPESQYSSYSSPNNTYASSGSSISHPHASTSQPQPPAHSFDLFSPNQGLVHQRSSARNDLGTPRPNVLTSDPAQNHVCAECGKGFLTSPHLREHSLTHSGEHLFPCTHPDCGRRFSTNGNMKQHMCTHTVDTVQLDSADDGGQYTPRNDLDTPESRLSTSDPPRKHVCTECGKRFISQSALRQHLFTHSGERPFQCTHPGCGRRFGQASHVKRHMHTHRVRFYLPRIPHGNM